MVILLENLPFDRDARVRRQTASLVDAGYEVTVICPRRTWRVPPQGDAAIRLLTYPRPRDATSAIGYLAEYAYSLVATGVLMAWLALVRGFDVVQACNPPDLFWPLAAPYQWFGKRYVFDHHDLAPELYRGKFARGGLVFRTLLALERQAVRRADAVITTNATMRDLVSERSGVSVERFEVVRNGPRLDDIGLRDAREELKAGRRWLCCWHGVMGQQDGVDLAVEAAAVLVHELGRQDCTFVLIGDGEVRSDVERLAEERGIAAWIEFPGWLDYDELSDYLATADVGMSPDPPGHDMDWSTPIKAIEYMGFGVPVVGFQRAEQVASVDGGGVFVEDSPEALARAIDQLLSDEPCRKELGAQGRRRIEEGLAWDHQVRRYLDLYRRLVDVVGVQ